MEEYLKKRRQFHSSGRPSKDVLDTEYWTEGDGLAKVKEWLDQNYTDTEIARSIGVSRQCVYHWKKRCPMFRDLFDVARKVADVKLTHTMIKSAEGFYYDEEVVDNKGRVVTVKKWQAPNATLQIFLKKNWDRQNYRDRWEIEHSGSLPVILKGEDEIPE